MEAQGGNEKAEYGQALWKNLSGQLTVEFGKGFDVTNLGWMKQFYLTFKNIDALRQQLSWTHYRLLMKVEKEEIRNFYINLVRERATDFLTKGHKAHKGKTDLAFDQCG